MFASPQVYISTILSGAASRGGLRSAAVQRLARLGSRFGDVRRYAALQTEGELAALGWMCEVVALAEIATQFRERILWLDFDDFLARPAAGLSTVLERLNADASRPALDAMLASPHWSRYSKAPEHAYGADLRQEILARGRQLHRVRSDARPELDQQSCHGATHRSRGDQTDRRVAQTELSRSDANLRAVAAVNPPRRNAVSRASGRA